MNYCTIGREVNPGKVVKLWYNPKETFDLNPKERFRLVFVQEGAGILKQGGQARVFTAPVVFCLNELEEPQLEISTKFEAKSLYFHPCFINSMFGFENIRGSREQFTESEYRDRQWLRPFIHRNDTYQGIFNLGLVTAMRINSLLETIDQELSQQIDGYWPCRSRSFLLELLFIFERLFYSPEGMGDIVLNETSNDINRIVLHLHTSYQDKITIPELTKKFNINRTALAENFNKITGMPVMTYLTKLRINLACLMLRDTMVPVSEIMERVGFQDSTHFGRTFRKHTGFSPSDYRQRYCWLGKKLG